MLRLAVALRARDVTVDVLAPAAAGRPGRESLAGVPVRRYRYAPRAWETVAYTGTMASAARRSWRARLAVAGLAAGCGLAALREPGVPDVVHAHWWFPGGLTGGWLAGWWRRPLVITLHGSDVRTFQGFPFGPRLFARVLRRAQGVTTVSSWLADAVRRLVPGVEPVVAPMPVAPDLFAPGARGNEDPRVLFVGKLNEQKGIRPFLEAFARLGPTVTGDVVVGVGSDDAPWRALAGSLGIADRLRWHPLLEQTALARLYREVNLLIMPAVDEGLGLVAVEAQLSGTPVVGFASGGLTDVVVDGRTGFLVPVHDTAALAAAATRALNLPDRGAALGVEGRRHALAQFAPDAVAARYADLYRDVRRGAGA